MTEDEARPGHGQPGRRGTGGRAGPAAGHGDDRRRRIQPGRREPPASDLRRRPVRTRAADCPGRTGRFGMRLLRGSGSDHHRAGPPKSRIPGRGGSTTADGTGPMIGGASVGFRDPRADSEAGLAATVAERDEAVKACRSPEPLFRTSWLESPRQACARTVAPGPCPASLFGTSFPAPIAGGIRVRHPFRAGSQG